MLLPLLLLFAFPQDDGCRRCDHTGVVPCSRHKGELHAMESAVHICSVAAACKKCGGTLFVDCRSCEGGSESVAVEAHRAEIAEWLANEPLRAHFDRPVLMCETEHFQLVLDLEPMKEGRKKVDPHVLLHRVAQDVEHVASRIAEHYAVEPGDYHSKMRMWMWQEVDDHSSAMERFMTTITRGDFKLLGKDPVFSVWREPGLFDSVPVVRSLFAHNAGHMLVSNLYDQLWVGDIGGGWLDAGVGHWYEYDLMERSVHYCIEESNVPLDYHEGVWRAPIRKRLEDKKESTFHLGRLLPLNTGAMSLPDQALCWSFYDWLVAEHSAQLSSILRRLKKRESARDLLLDALGMSLIEAEQAWREWVSAVYPRRGDTPRRSKDD